MKVLISAYACEPNRGAEPGVGWNIVRELSRDHELWVLTRADNQAAIEAYEGEWAKTVHWHYVDPPRWITRWKSGNRILRLFYVMWQRAALVEGRKLSKEVDFDLAHHLTFGTYLVPCLLGSLGIPLVIGPVGGGETSPPLLKKSYELRGRIAELSRDVMRLIVQNWPPFRRRLLSGSTVIAATEQTRAVLESMSEREVKLVPQSGIGDDEVDRFAQKMGKRKKGKENDELTLVAASRLIHWKAIDLAIEAVGLAKERGAKVKLHILQGGLEREKLEELVSSLDLQKEVEFEGHLPTLDDVYDMISQSDALIHPALHEVFGQACLESLALGVPVICIDWCGPGMIIDEETGFKVTPGDRADTLDGLANAIISLRDSLPRRSEMSAACRKRAVDHFHWQIIADEIRASYQEAVDNFQMSSNK